MLFKHIAKQNIVFNFQKGHKHLVKSKRFNRNPGAEALFQPFPNAINGQFSVDHDTVIN